MDAGSGGGAEGGGRTRAKPGVRVAVVGRMQTWEPMSSSVRLVERMRGERCGRAAGTRLRWRLRVWGKLVCCTACCSEHVTLPRPAPLRPCALPRFASSPVPTRRSTAGLICNVQPPVSAPACGAERRNQTRNLARPLDPAPRSRAPPFYHTKPVSINRAGPRRHLPSTLKGAEYGDGLRHRRRARGNHSLGHSTSATRV